MTTNIRSIREITNRGNIHYYITYKSGRHKSMTDKDTLPMSAVDFIVSDEIDVTTRYAVEMNGTTTKITDYRQRGGRA